jgi:cytochrome bd-type quinol oxidase subunit 2
MLNMATSRIILTVLLWAVVGVLVVAIIKGMRADQSWPQMVITAVSVTVVGSFITLRRARGRQRN